MPSELLLNQEFMPLVESGQKTSTVRKGIRNYQFLVGEPLVLKSEDQELEVQITGVENKAFGHLRAADAKRDGFGSRLELVETIRSIYGELHQHQPMTIIHFTNEPEQLT